MKIKALISFTTDDLAVSLRMGEVAEISDNLATELIADGYVEAYSEGGGGDDMVFVTTMANNDGVYVLGNTWAEIHSAMSAGKVCFAHVSEENLDMVWTIAECFGEPSENYYRVTCVGMGSALELETDSTEGYPSKTVE